MPDFFVLDSQMQPKNVIEDFNSMLWVERYNNLGLFKLVADRKNSLIANLDGTDFIGKSDSRYFMYVDDVDDDYEAGLVTVTGRTGDLVMKYRTSFNSGAYTAGQTWKWIGYPTAAAIGVIRNAIASGYTPNDALYSIDNLSVTNSVGDAGVSSTFELPIQEAYTNLKNLLDPINVGWRMRRTFDSLTVNFDIYQGVDRSAYPADGTIMFTPQRDNFRKGVLRRRGNEYATHGILYGNSTVYYRSSPFNIGGSGFLARVIPIDGEDIKMTNVTAAQLQAMLENKADAAFRQRLETAYIDGEVVSKLPGQYVYGTDYNLGDQVLVSHSGGYASAHRVVEHTTSVDQEGIREFPTLEPV